MSRSPFSRTRTHVARRRALSALAAAAAVVVAAPSPAPASQTGTDTFSGSCRGLEGAASWPEQPLTIVPVDMLMRARLSGGECSGTLNGREVRSAPAAARASVRGPQSCAGGATSGRFEFKLAGRTISGAMTYRRVGPRVTALWQGDGGGSAAVVVHAQTGVVGPDHPLAAAPVVGSHISAPTTTGETVRRCSEEGLSRIPIGADAITTLPSLSG